MFLRSDSSEYNCCEVQYSHLEGMPLQRNIYEISIQFSLTVVLVSLFCASPASADVRADYLISLLKNGSSYRVKIQAAQSLGRIQCREAIPALEDALDDESSHVVIAAAAALGEIGDPAAIPALKTASRKGHSAAVINQIQATIRLLQDLMPEAGPDKNDVAATAESEFLIKVDAMGNSSTSSTEGVTDILRAIVVDELLKKQGVEIQSSSMSETDVKQRIKKGKAKAFILSGALIKLQREEQFMVAKIALNVLSNPDYNLIMMPSGEARIQIDFSALQAARQQGASKLTISQLEKTAIESAEKRVLKKLVENLVGKILEAVPNVL